MPNSFEIIESVLFDTLSIPLGMRSLDRAEMFQIPIGAMIYNDPLTGEPRVKDYTETNMQEPEMLSAPQEFTVRSIRAALFCRRGELLPITSRYYRGIILDLRIGQKSYWRGPLWLVADPAVLFAAASGGLAGFDKDERLELVRNLRLKLGDGVWIQRQQRFSVPLMFDPSFDWPSLAAPGSLVVVLEGMFARPVM